MICYSDLLPGDMIVSDSSALFVISVKKGKNFQYNDLDVKITFMTLWGCHWDGIRELGYNSQAQGVWDVFRP